MALADRSVLRSPATQHPVLSTQHGHHALSDCLAALLPDALVLFLLHPPTWPNPVPYKPVRILNCMFTARCHLGGAWYRVRSSGLLWVG